VRRNEYPANRWKRGEDKRRVRAVRVLRRSKRRNPENGSRKADLRDR
jgi:hypothetical protein